MWFIGVEVEQETSAPAPKKKILDPPLRFDGSGGTMSLQVDLSNLPVMTNGKNPKSFKQLFHLIYLLGCPSTD